MTISDSGVIYIKQFMAGIKSSIAESIAYGISGEVSVPDQGVGFELDYSNIKIIAYDWTDDVIVMKASLPVEIEAVIYEVAIVGDVSDKTNSKIITTFEQTVEQWDVGTWVNTHTRIGPDSLHLAPTASGTVTSTLTNISLDLSENSGSDQFVLAFYSYDTHTSDVKMRFLTDSSNYYTLDAGDPTPGYNFYRVSKSALVSTGAPDWSNITSFQAIASADSGAGAQVDFDGLRIQNINGVDPEYTVIARKVLDTPYIKVAGRQDDIEYRLGTTINES